MDPFVQWHGTKKRGQNKCVHTSVLRHNTFERKKKENTAAPVPGPSHLGCGVLAGLGQRIGPRPDQRGVLRVPPPELLRHVAAVVAVVRHAELAPQLLGTRLEVQPPGVRTLLGGRRAACYDGAGVGGDAPPRPGRCRTLPKEKGGEGGGSVIWGGGDQIPNFLQFRPVPTRGKPLKIRGSPPFWVTDVNGAWHQTFLVQPTPGLGIPPPPPLGVLGARYTWGRG